MKRFFILFILFVLSFSFILIICKNYSNAVSKDLSDTFFRLHIIANSDSKEDQDLKLKIRDNILEYMNSKNFSSKDKAINYSYSNIEKFYEIAKRTIDENGFDYNVNINIGSFYFPTKHYGNITLPAGYYDGLKIEIGESKGQNWWCSLFPPLCFTDISCGVIEEDDLQTTKDNLNNEEFNLITSNNPDIKFKFKIIELINKR